jgi:uncharacterized membrane protein
MDKARVEAFSDGVLAIAITLLTLELHVETGTMGLWASLLDAWPQFAAYLVSFMIVGIIWVNHHTVFRFVAVVDRPLLFLNLFALLFVTLVPFVTALFAEHIREGGTDSHVAAALYSANGFGIAISFNLLWRWIVRDDRLVHAHIDLEAAQASTRRYGLGLVVYPVAIALSFVSAPITLALHFVVAVFYAIDQLVHKEAPAVEV